MNERILKAALMSQFRESLPHYVALRHEDRLSSGHPDISITGNKVTSWLECKYGTPSFASKGIQELTMLRLAKAGSAVYVVWIHLKDSNFTYIVQPSSISLGIYGWTLYTEGFDHKWVVNQIKGLHNDHTK